jgi:intracellular multiplication protein IcmO
MRAPIEHKKEVKKYYIDPRSSGRKLLDALSQIENVFILHILFIGLSIYQPIFMLLNLVMYILFSCTLNFNAKALRTLPLRLPKYAGNIKDFNSPKTANRYKFQKANALIYVGNELFNKKELWEPTNMLLTHFLVLGATGAGKTQALISLNAASSLILGGAMIYLDAKASIDVSFYFYNLARIFGREDSLRFMSFRTGNKSVQSGDWRKLSNTVGIFSMGSSNVIIQLIEGMMPEGGQNQVFKDKALSILKGFIPCAEELRDKKVINLTPYMISQLMTIPKLIQISYPELFDNKITYNDFYTGQEITIPNVVSERKKRALRDLVLEKLGIATDEKSLKDPTKQPPEVGRQFSYADGYIIKPMTDFSSTYGHIFECQRGEVNTSDIMLNNHMLLIYVPAVESSQDQKKTQGGISLSMIRLAIANGMGDKSEGHIDDILNNLPIDKSYISTITVDEYAEAAGGVTGFAVTSTQARGFGVSVIFSNQDIAGMLNSSEEETKQIFANTRIKYLMTMEDPNETLEWFSKLAGELSVLTTSSYEKGNAFSYIDSLQGSVQNVSRINFLDIKEQEASEAHIFEGSKLIRASVFYHGLDKLPQKDFQFSRQLEIDPPTIDEVEELKQKYMAKRVIIEMIKRNQYPPTKKSNLNANPKDSKWIEKLLNIESSTADNKKNVDLDSHDTHTEEQESIQSDTPKSKSTNTLKVGKITQTKANGWVFSFKSVPNLSNEKALAKSLSAIATAAGVSEESANELAAKKAVEINNSLKYTSEPIESKTSDEDALWAALKAFD